MPHALKQALLHAAAAMAAALMAPATGAQSIGRGDQRAWVQLGVMGAGIDSLIRVDYLGNSGLGLPAAGTTLDFEDDLGLRRRKAVPSVVLGLRLAERWHLEFETYSLTRSATQTVLDEAVVIGGTTYSATAQLQSSFSSRVQRLSLGYGLFKTPTAELGVAVGVQYTRYRLAFVGTGSVNGEPPSVSRVEESDRGPLPTAGLFGSVALSDAWSSAARVDYMPVDSKRLRGYLGNVEANLYYRMAPNWSLGLGYKAVSYKVVRKSDGDFGARFEYRFRGPQVLLEAGW